MDIRTDYTFEDWGTNSSNNIWLYVDDEYAGFLAFSADNNEKYLETIDMEVNDEYKGKNLSYELYKKFGEIYTEKFNGWPVARHFVNPIAEYSFRNAVSKGLVPESALNEPEITRNYSKYDQQMITDLRNKLPENLRGPEVWSRLRKKQFRNINGRKDDE